ncbi:hypothetical protein A2U01_0078054, partial [Trifolium medium]|nr:hypothetical protein [Trifolium medium]
MDRIPVNTYSRRSIGRNSLATERISTAVAATVAAVERIVFAVVRFVSDEVEEKEEKNEDIFVL